MKKLDRKCLYCGRKFKVHPYRVKEGRGKFCSKACWYASKRGKPIEHLKEIRKKGVCINSGRTHFKKGFTPWNKGRKTGLAPKSGFKMGHMAWNKGLHIYTGGKKFETGHIPWNKKEIITKKCLTCGKGFTRYPARMKREETKYCSWKCTGKAKRGTKLSEEWKRKIGEGMKGHKNAHGKRWKLSEETRKKQSESNRRRWMDKKYREKMIDILFKNLRLRPTSIEQQMIKIIKKHNLPYKYVGDGNFWIGRKNPDFVNINGEKKLIEVGSHYYHPKVKDYEDQRRKHFERYGWKSYFFITAEKLLNEGKILAVLS